MEVLSVSRIPALQSSHARYVQRVTDALRRMSDELRSDHVNASSSVDSKTRLSEASKKLTESFKEYHVGISRFSKELDKVLEGTRSSFESRLPDVSACAPTVTSLIADFLCHKALPKATAVLSSEAALNKYSCFVRDMPQIQQDLKRGSTESVELWIWKNRFQIGKRLLYELCFEVSQIRFLSLLEVTDDDQFNKASLFATQTLSRFYLKHEQETRELMHLLIRAGEQREAILKRKSAGLRRLLHLVKTECAKINGLFGEGLMSDLEILLNTGRSAGSIASTAMVFVKPQIDDIISPTQSKTLRDLEQSGLQVDFKIDVQYRYHSSFCCPVSKQPATEGDAPVLLNCGHAILGSSMKSLPRRSGKFKCPICYGASEDGSLISLVM